MEKRHFANIGKDISLLGFGCMRLPRIDPDKTDIDYEAGQAMVDAAIAGGVNYFDTAWPYHEGKSEPFIGHALRHYPRESVYLATKLPVRALKSADDVERIFNEQLERCTVDYFDFYLAHNLNRDNYAIHESFGVYDLLRKKKEQGLIRHLGFSIHDNTDLVRRIVDTYEWDFVQIQLNYLDWDSGDAKGQYAILTERNLPVVIMEPVRGGVLASLNDEANSLLRAADPDASAASWAIRYAASLPGVMTVLSGMTALEHVEDNLKTMTGFKPLEQKDYELLTQVAAAFRASGTIPCTGCRYCMDCPAGVDIPRVIAAYNYYCTSKNAMRFGSDYRTLRDSELPRNCVGCGVCVEQCPQDIDIPARMKEIAAFADSLNG